MRLTRVRPRAWLPQIGLLVRDVVGGTSPCSAVGLRVSLRRTQSRLTLRAARCARESLATLKGPTPRHPEPSLFERSMPDSMRCYIARAAARRRQSWREYLCAACGTTSGRDCQFGVRNFAAPSGAAEK